MADSFGLKIGLEGEKEFKKRWRISTSHSRCSAPK